MAITSALEAFEYAKRWGYTYARSRIGVSIYRHPTEQRQLEIAPDWAALYIYRNSKRGDLINSWTFEPPVNEDGDVPDTYAIPDHDFKLGEIVETRVVGAGVVLKEPLRGELVNIGKRWCSIKPEGQDQVLTRIVTVRRPAPAEVEA